MFTSPIYCRFINFMHLCNTWSSNTDLQASKYECTYVAEFCSRLCMCSFYCAQGILSTIRQFWDAPATNS